jgi:hypothetical protein
MFSNFELSRESLTFYYDAIQLKQIQTVNK